MEFLKLKFVGKQFNHHKLPIEILGVLCIVREIILEIAKFAYKEKLNTTRLPKKYFDKVQLVLGSVEPGSAIPIIEMHGLDSAIDMELIGYVTEGKKRFLNIAKQAKIGDIDSSKVPNEVFKKYAKLGRNLDDGSILELPDPDDDSHYLQIDAATIYKLALVSETNTENVFFQGKLFKVDTKANVMTFETSSGIIAAKFPDRLKDKAKKYLDRFVIGSGIARVTSEGTLISIEHIQHLSMLTIDETKIEDLENRISEIKELDDAWYGQNLGHKFNSLELDEVGTILTNLALDKTIPIPLLFPSLEKNEIRLEWLFSDGSVDVNLDIHTKIGYITGILELEDRDFSLFNSDDRQTFITYILKKGRVITDDQ